VTLNTDAGTYEQAYSGNITAGESQAFMMVVSQASPTLYMLAGIDINPDTLNLGSKGKWISCYIELYRDVNVSSIDVSSILLNGTVPVDPKGPSTIGDYDSDGIPDLMVKFNRTAVSEYILSTGVRFGNVTLTVSGKLYDGTLFEGSDTIMARMPGDVNCDGKVDAKDVRLC
jgi:hypothetical protein